MPEANSSLELQVVGIKVGTSANFYSDFNFFYAIFMCVRRISAGQLPENSAMWI
jgi:hypothetical protein